MSDPLRDIFLILSFWNNYFIVNDTEVNQSKLFTNWTLFFTIFASVNNIRLTKLESSDHLIRGNDKLIFLPCCHGYNKILSVE